MFMVNGEENMLTVRDLAEYLDLKRSSVYRLIRQGEIPAEKVGNRLMVKFTAAEQWLDEKTRPELCA